MDSEAVPDAPLAEWIRATVGSPVQTWPLDDPTNLHKYYIYILKKKEKKKKTKTALTHFCCSHYNRLTFLAVQYDPI